MASSLSTGDQKKASDQSFQVAAPSLALPKGGGAIRGIDEKFAANPVRGTGTLTIPIAVSLGQSGFGPQLTLSYDPGSGNGPFGPGWSLSLPSITRRTEKGLPQYQDAGESDIRKFGTSPYQLTRGANHDSPILRELLLFLQNERRFRIDISPTDT